MAPTTAADESTPLISGKPPTPRRNKTNVSSLIHPAATYDNDDPRVALFQFLEGTSPFGARYEKFTISLIFLSVITSILSSVFLPEYNTTSEWADKCDTWCDAIWFGNRRDNVLSQLLGIGSTSLVEIFVVGAFTIDYILRIYTADMIDPIKYAGVFGRLRFMITFFALVDLFSIVPFYIDAFLLPNTELGGSTFLRMFRLLRMMKVEGRFDLALGLIDDVFYAQKDVLGTALFVGITVWAVLSSFFYLAERRNTNMIYCGAAPEHCQDVDTSLCSIDEWGIVDCSLAGCRVVGDNGTVMEEVCWNVYRSILDSSFWTLMNLFGEYPIFEGHSISGKILGTFTAAFAVAVFALPVGVLASGFEDQIARRKQKRRITENRIEDTDAEANEGVETEKGGAARIGDTTTVRGWTYNFLHRQDSASARYFASFVSTLISGCVLAFVVDSVVDADGKLHILLKWFQLCSGLVFAAEYSLVMYSAGVNPNYEYVGGLVKYAMSPLRIIDVLSIGPYFIGLLFTSGNAPSVFLLLKILRFRMCYDPISTLWQIFEENIDVLSVTGFSAALLWILFSSLLYYTERNNPNQEIKKYYNTIPNSMWITLLNLSGECPLAYYSSVGKVVVGFIGLFATAVFGVPIGVLGAGFEELVTNKYDESPDEEATTDSEATINVGNINIQLSIYQFVNGIGSTAGIIFELSIYLLIGVTVSLGIVQTVPGYENFGHQVEWCAVMIFTVEYILRLIGAAADPDFASCSNGFMARVKYIFSFYSVIDLLAILPFYYAYMNPDSWINAHDEYLRMMRLIRLLKLDKYVPSISLLDDVFRLKRRILVVAGYAALTLWFLFSAAMYIAERSDDSMEIDPVPLYGCVEGCSMSNRYTDFLTSLPLTGIHLTGDFPLIEYGGFGRVILFFIVITAVGIVAVPSGVIASGFAEIVELKHAVTNKVPGFNKGDDWYDIKYRQLSGQSPSPSSFGPAVDAIQMNVKEYLDGRVDETTREVTRTHLSTFGRVFFATLIITNIIAIILESVPEIDKRVGNSSGNFFDEFEKWSVFFFTSEYMLRLISASKSRTALYSPWVYATTFFGIVDLVSILPWYIQIVLVWRGNLSVDDAKVFRIVRIFRVLQLEDFLVAFSKLDNVFRASKDVLKATGLLAIIIWVGTSALFFIFEQNNPNFRECDDSIPLFGTQEEPGCADFESTSACNEFYPDMCSQTGFDNMPNVMYYVAVFLVGEWGVVDFTWKGKLVCMATCIAGIALYSIPVGSLFDSFGAVIGLSEEEDDDNDERELEEEGSK